MYVNSNNSKGQKIWNEVLAKIRVSSYGMVRSKEFFSESIHCIEAHLDMIAEILEVHSSVSFELYIDEEFN